MSDEAPHPIATKMDVRIVDYVHSTGAAEDFDTFTAEKSLRRMFGRSAPRSAASGHHKQQNELTETPGASTASK